MVPEKAVYARLIVHYEVISGQDIDVTVSDQEGCSSADSSSDAGGDTNQSLLGSLYFCFENEVVGICDIRIG